MNARRTTVPSCRRAPSAPPMQWQKPSLPRRNADQRPPKIITGTALGRRDTRDKHTHTDRERVVAWALPLSFPPLSSSLLIRSPFPFIECQIMFGWSGLVPKFPGSAVFLPFPTREGQWHPRSARAKGRKEGRTIDADGRRE